MGREDFGGWGGEGADVHCYRDSEVSVAVFSKAEIHILKFEIFEKFEKFEKFVEDLDLYLLGWYQLLGFAIAGLLVLTGGGRGHLY